MYNIIICWCSTRKLHSCVYEKKDEDLAAWPTMVPENIVDELHSGKYWAPNPTTGVFGPEHTVPPSPATEGALPATVSGSVLEQKVWFRHGDEAQLRWKSKNLVWCWQTMFRFYYRPIKIISSSKYIICRCVLFYVHLVFIIIRCFTKANYKSCCNVESRKNITNQNK